MRITADENLRFLGNYTLVDELKGEFGDKISVISIGPADERKMAAASVAATDMELRPNRHAGRGGVGAVIGAKGVKAIIFDDNGCTMRNPKDSEKFKEANKRLVAGLRKHSVTGEGLPAYGINMITNVVNEAGVYPTKNFMLGRFNTASKISGETQAELEETRGGESSSVHGCHRVFVIRCSGTFKAL